MFKLQAVRSFISHINNRRRRGSVARAAAIASHALESLESRQLLSAGNPFAIALLSDTQYVVESYPQDFHAQTQWLADNAQPRNIAMATHQGDLLRRGYSSYQIANADAALDRLNGIIPYSVSIGNHDYDNQFDDLDHHISSAKFAETFGDARYTAIPGSGFGGSSLDQRNRYQVFNAGGRQMMLLTIEWEAPDNSIAWAQGVINAHRHLPIILSTHEYLNSLGRTTSPLDPLGNDGEDIFQKLVKLNPQIFMVVGGHTGGERHQTSTNLAGSAVFEILADYSGKPNGGDGWMQLLDFDPANNVINATTYSPKLSQFETDSNSQYTLSINFDQRFAFAPAGVPIGSDEVYDVTPGQKLSVDAPQGVLANDLDSDTGMLTAALVAGPAGFTLNPDGSFTFAPAGTFSFTYTVSDGVNTGNVATATVRVNTVPVGNNDSAQVYESKSITLNVVGNDADADGNTLKPILASLPGNGAVFVNANGTLTYTPDPRFVGTDTFTYVVSDGTANGGVATVTINVLANAPIYNYAIGENTIYGTRINGSFTATFAGDGIEEVIREVLRQGYSDLEQRWQFNVAAGTDITFCIKAKRSIGADEFRLHYSTNGSTWLDMTKIVPASSLSVTRILYDADQPYQMWNLPASTKGTVWIRATDNNSGETALSTLSVDEMFIRSGVPVPPTAPPAAPTGLTGTKLSQRRARLNWVDNADNESGFRIYASQNNVTWTLVAPTAANVLTYTSGTLPRGTWSFRVAAFNVLGESAFSNVVTLSL